MDIKILFELKISSMLEVPDPLIVFENATKARRNLIYEVCGKENLLGKSAIPRKEFYFIRNESLLWCPVFKAASTSWILNLFNLMGLSENKTKELQNKYPGQLDRQLRAVSPIVSKKEIDDLNVSNSTKSVIITRHPFSRLISAYRDKIERSHEMKPNSSEVNIEKDWYFKKYGKEIIKRYRKKYLEKFGFETLTEKNNFGSPFPTSQRSAELPTFWEFVQYLNSFSKYSTMDPHWRPINVYCTPCSFHYNFILKFENIAEEQVHFTNYLGNGERFQEIWGNSNHGKVSDTEITDKYFRVLSDSEIWGLVKIYRLDFQMFNYTFSYRNQIFI